MNTVTQILKFPRGRVMVSLVHNKTGCWLIYSPVDRHTASSKTEAPTSNTSQTAVNWCCTQVLAFKHSSPDRGTRKAFDSRARAGRFKMHLHFVVQGRKCWKEAGSHRSQKSVRKTLDWLKLGQCGQRSMKQDKQDHDAN